ncbi:uncharacterized protein LOC134232215 [Saccostrea cucullata]|uniref:uncharacterized protein LOC134232215 n=1 Tax=Saccostrea cuccullata TaxID=36930 RepID=UPI002ED31D04
MMYELVLQKSVTVPGVNSVGHISHVTSDQVWISDGTKSLILTNTLGDELQHLKDVLTTFTGVHTVNIDGDLIYIDRKYNISKLCTENKLRTLLINLTEPWEPQCVYSSPSTGDLLVGMRYYTNLTNIGKVVRYNSTGKIIQTIQHNNITGQGLYSRPKYITENRNGDVIVSDLYRFAVVVTDRDGNYRFSYTGPPPAHQLKPLGICTDALSHILVCDFITWSVQMLDQHGKFLSQILLHGIDKPQCLSYDEETHLLWVGAYNNYTVKIYKVVDGDSLTDTLVPTLPPVPQNLILSPSTLRTPQPASSQDRPQLESTYPRTVLTAQITSTSTLVRPRSPLSQERVESIHPWTASPDVCPSTRSTMEDFGPPNTQEIREFSYPWTAPSSTVTSATTLEGLRSPLTQGRHQLESTYPWIPPAHMSSIRSTLEQLGPPGTRERPQLVSSHLSTTHPVDVTPTQHPIEFEREFDDFPSSSTKTVPVSESPPPRKTRKLVQRGNIKDGLFTTVEFSASPDIGDSRQCCHVSCIDIHLRSVYAALLRLEKVDRA